MRTTAYLKAIMEVHGKTVTGLGPTSVTDLSSNLCKRNGPITCDLYGNWTVLLLRFFLLLGIRHLNLTPVNM